ncbi:hypothetical protein CUN61_17375 [Pseudomonas arsenicoxydans]|uniref:Uncharacterized protein n=1 Tax=Pseudomonas arsenicoxydans TaxID=702115 RepID=A0A4P6G5Y0_9PSED|nr:hypothetical protein CUN61_17375 [Pseudomonas arsenicoxydans]
MLRVGMHPVTLRVTLRKTQAWCRQRNAERPRRHSHAERGNDQQQQHREQAHSHLKHAGAQLLLFTTLQAER